MAVVGSDREGLVSAHSREIAGGERFSFGANWLSFLDTVDGERTAVAIDSVKSLLGLESLAGKTFLDVGSGSGLFSLAARSLGAEVTSFDYDPQSVESTTALQRRYFPDDPRWKVTHGSVLEAEFVHSLGKFDVVYSWGVLHHTGSMWQALDLITHSVAPNGLLAIAIYNDQGLRSTLWRGVKQLYCSGRIGSAACKAVFYPYFALIAVAQGLRDHGNPIAGFAQYKKRRGMSIIHDWRDWLGGYPFEVASPGALTEFFASRGFKYERGKCTSRLGCNELVFRRESPAND